MPAPSDTGIPRKLAVSSPTDLPLIANAHLDIAVAVQKIVVDISLENGVSLLTRVGCCQAL